MKNLSPITAIPRATTRRIGGAMIALVVLASRCHALAQQTAFSYSGVLYGTNVSQTGTGPAIGTFDFRCSLWPSLAEANPANRIGPTNSFSVTLNAGAFATTLDFGQLTGGPYFLQTDVRRSGGVTFKTLVPRKQILPVPLAQHANTASNLLGTVSSTSLTGTIADARLSPNVPLLNGSPSFSGTVTASGFVGDGSGLSNLNGGAVQQGSIPNAAIADSTVTAGKIAGGQVVKSLNGLSDAVTLSAGPNITLTPSGTSVQIAAIGGGGLSWQVVPGTAQQAQPNTGYLLTNDTQATLTLPASLNVGDVVRLNGSGAGGWKIAQNAGQSIVTKSSQCDCWVPRENNRNWNAVACSADGSKLVAVVFNGQIYTSTDSGATWTARDANRYWQAVTSSADGAKLVAVESPGQIYTSVNSGATWTPRESSRDWISVASSADGSKLVATAEDDQIYTSTDSGVTWTPRDSVRRWGYVSSSADGTKLVAVTSQSETNPAVGGYIYVSSDSGATWTPRDIARFWEYTASSADGTKLVATADQIYTSTDSGATWTARETTRAWYGVASSSDGSRLIAIVYGGQIYTSLDAGATWMPHEGNRNWSAVASSSDGSKLVASVWAGQIYTATVLTLSQSTVGVSGYLLGEPYSAIELQYTGNGLFVPVSHEGVFVPY